MIVTRSLKSTWEAYTTSLPVAFLWFMIMYAMYVIKPEYLELRDSVKKSTLYNLFIQLNYVFRLVVLFIAFSLYSAFPTFIYFYKYHKHINNTMIIRVRAPGDY